MGSRAIAALFGTRSRTITTMLVTSIMVLSSIWFFTARDERDRTARLTADAWYYHAYLPSMVFDQDLDFRDEYKITKNWYRLGKTPTGRQANVFGIGPAIYQLPFFLVGHGIAKISGSEANGFSRPEVKLSLYASLLFSLGALFLAARLLTRRLGGRYGPVLVALLVACGGPVVYYAIRQPGYAHPFATFWAAWLVDYWDASFDEGSAPRTRRFWILFGLLIGAASLARPQLVLWSLLGGYAAYSDLIRARARGMDRQATLKLVGPWLLGALCALVIVLPQLLAWNSLYGSAFASPQGEGFMRWGESAWVDTLMSSRNGLFPWAPIYAIGGIGLLVGLKRHARLSSALLGGLLLQAYANGAAWDWWAGGSFGGRRFDSCFVAFAFGLGILLLTPWRPRGGSTVDKSKLRQAKGMKLGAVSLAALSIMLVGANLRLAAGTSAPSARIYGGQPASSILLKTTGIFGRPAAWTSSLSNLPTRVAYAWKNDAGLDAYDKIVGVHHLGELFPGLNSFRGKKQQRVDLNPARANVSGLKRDEGGKLIAGAGTAQLLIGLNRLGPVQMHFRTDYSGAQGQKVFLNDNEVEVQSLGAGNYEATLVDYDRGSNRIEIIGPRGFELKTVSLSANVNAAGDTVPGR